MCKQTKCKKLVINIHILLSSNKDPCKFIFEEVNVFLKMFEYRVGILLSSCDFEAEEDKCHPTIKPSFDFKLISFSWHTRCYIFPFM